MALPSYAKPSTVMVAVESALAVIVPLCSPLHNALVNEVCKLISLGWPIVISTLVEQTGSPTFPPGTVAKTV